MLLLHKKSPVAMALILTACCGCADASPWITPSCEAPVVAELGTSGERRACAWSRTTGLLIDGLGAGYSQARALAVRDNPRPNESTTQEFVMRFVSGAQIFVSRPSVVSSVHGRYRLRQLTGADLFWHQRSRPRPDEHPDARTAGVTSLRNSAGSLFYAHGTITEKDQFEEVIPELQWKEIDLGCPFDPTSKEFVTKGMAVEVTSSGGTRAVLESGQSAHVSLGCYTATLHVDQVYRSNGAAQGFSSRQPTDEIEFSLIADGILED